MSHKAHSESASIMDHLPGRTRSRKGLSLIPEKLNQAPFYRAGFWILLGVLCLWLLQSRLRAPPYPANRQLDPYTVKKLKDVRICDRSYYPPLDSLLEDRVTILVNGFSEARIPLLKKNMLKYSESLVVDSILVLWGNTSTPDSILGKNWESAGAPIHIIRQKTSSLNDRFLPRPGIHTKVVVICDDDITADHASLAFALNAWQENQHRIVGFFPRAHVYNVPYKTWVYAKLPDKYSIMLTKFMLLHTEYLFRYTCHTPPGVKEYVDKGMNCEDIAMNFLVSGDSGAGPLLVSGSPRDWGDTRNSDDELSSLGLSARKGHRKDRGLCIAAFSELWGGMELRYSQYKAVSDVSEQVFCDKFGLLVHCDVRAPSRLIAERALGHHLVKREVKYAYTTLVGSAELIPAALVFAQSLRCTGSIHDLILMVDDTSNLDLHDPILLAHYDRVQHVKSVSNKYNVKGFNKLNAWLLEEYAKVIYIDVDTMVLANLDHLFEHPEPSAVPDVYMSGKFNSGVLVLKPSKVTYEAMLSQLDHLPSYNKGDQGFLNSFFDGWYEMPAAHRLPSRYNAVFLFPNHYHPPPWFHPDRVYEAMGPIAVVHFAGPWYKPWRNDTNTTKSVWCGLWVKVAHALEVNEWKPLDSAEFSVRELLPNPQDYMPYPQAPLGSWPRGLAENVKAPHQQVVPPRPYTRREAFVTVLWEANYFAAGVWATSHQQHHTFNQWRKTVLLVSSTLDELKWLPFRRLFNVVRVVSPIVLEEGERELGPEFLLLHVWDQTRFDKVVFVHPLAFFTDNCNDLFRYEPFAAIPSVFPGDMFSSKVMVVQPSADTFSDLVRKASTLSYPEHSVDRFLNTYYYDWFQLSSSHRLPSSFGVDMWFKEGLMKFFSLWKILIFDERATPWTDFSDWMAHDRTKAVKLWRRTFCSLEDMFRPSEYDHICRDVEL